MQARRARTPEEAEAVRRHVAQLGFWYHNIDLGDGIWTNPEHPHGDHPGERWRFLEPYMPAEFRGASVLDIGCNAGWFSLQFKRLGASYVLGVDEVPRHIEQARFAAAELGYADIDYRCMSVYDIAKMVDIPGQFDVVVFLGVFYHLRHPLLVLDMVSRMRPKLMLFQTMLRGASGEIEIAGDYPIVEQRIFDNARYPAMYFVEERFAGDATNWWMANENAVKAMLRSFGFTRFTQTSNPEVFVCEAPTHAPAG